MLQREKNYEIKEPTVEYYRESQKRSKMVQPIQTTWDHFSGIPSIFPVGVSFILVNIILVAV